MNELYSGSSGRADDDDTRDFGRPVWQNANSEMNLN